MGSASTSGATRQTTILFICQGGTVKSPIAREHLRRLASAHNIEINITSRGITPEDHMTPALAAALVEDDINIENEPVQALTNDDLKSADVVVTFSPLPAEFRNRNFRDWTDQPSMNENYVTACAVLLPRLEALLNETKT